MPKTASTACMLHWKHNLFFSDFLHQTLADFSLLSIAMLQGPSLRLPGLLRRHAVRMRNTFQQKHLSSTTTSSRQPLSLNNYIKEVRPLLKPPVANRMIYNEQLQVMVVGGPNQRKVPTRLLTHEVSKTQRLLSTVLLLACSLMCDCFFVSFGMLDSASCCFK